MSKKDPAEQSVEGVVMSLEHEDVSGIPNSNSK